MMMLEVGTGFFSPGSPHDASLEIKMSNIMDRMERIETDMLAKGEIISSLKVTVDMKDRRIGFLQLVKIDLYP